MLVIKNTLPIFANELDNKLLGSGQVGLNVPVTFPSRKRPFVGGFLNFVDSLSFFPFQSISFNLVPFMEVKFQ